jgi:soluble lytic murein transglycosylase
MKFLFLISLVFSLAVADNSDSELELLPPDALKNEVIRRELALQGSEDAKDSVTRELLEAAVLYYDKKWDSAFFAYSQLLEKVPELLYGSVAIRVAMCELERGNIQDSRKVLLNIKSIKSNKNTWEQADRVLLEGVLRDTSIAQKAKKDSIDRRLKASSGEKYGQFLRWQMAKMQESEKDNKGAINNYLAILRTSGQYNDSAFRAMIRLAPNSTDYDFIRALCRRGNTEKCAENIGAILASKNIKLDSARKVNLMVLQAEAYRNLSKIDESVALYKRLLDSVEYNAAWMQSMLRMLRSNGNKTEAKRLDSIFQKKFQFSPENANNLWVKALEFEQSKDYKKAIDIYKQLYNAKFGKNQRRQWAKFRVGFINFKEEKYEEAAKLFAEAANENLGLMSRSGALYFYAESQRLLEKKDSLKAAYFAVIEDFPLGYYSWRAKQRLAEFELSDSIPRLGVQMTDSAVIAWLRALQRKDGARDTLVSVQRLSQIELLLRSGFESEAFALYDESFKLHKNRPEFYYRYGQMFMQNGEHALGHRLARNFLDLVPRQMMNEAPMQVIKFLFPTPHEAKVRKHAKIDPFLIYSVMRQESMFDASITSPANARGLLQIIPPTGESLAKMEKIEGYNRDLLYNAYLNIRLGVRYLNDLFDEFKGDYIGILGNYNAGPAPAKRWLANYGSLPWDIRVENVSYWETRDYVKRVLGNYWTYQEIYGD